MKNIPLFFLAFWLLQAFACCEPIKNADLLDADPDIGTLTAAILDFPSDASRHAARGKHFYQTDRYDRAITDFQTAVKLAPAQRGYYHALADAFFDSEQPDSAIAVLQKATTALAMPLPTLLKLTEMQQLNNQHDEAQQTLNRAAILAPQSADIPYLAAQIMLSNGDTSLASIQLQKAVTLDTLHAQSFLLLGDLAAKKNDMRAIIFYQKAMLNDELTIDAVLGMAEFYSQQQQFPKALALLDYAVSSFPQNPTIHCTKGILLLQQDSLAAALSAFNIALSIAPEYGAAYYYRSFIRSVGRDSAAAAADLSRARQLGFRE